LLSDNYIYPVSRPANYCCWDALDHNVLDCDERNYVVSDATVKIGSFGSAIQLQTKLDGTPRLLVRCGATLRSPGSTPAFPTHRSPSPAPPAGPAGALVECDAAHQVHESRTPVATATPVALPEEPYAMARPGQGLLYVGHLRGGFLSALDLGNPMATLPRRQRRRWWARFPGFPRRRQRLGRRDLAHLDGVGINSGRVYATSRYVPRPARSRRFRRAWIRNGQQPGDLSRQRRRRLRLAAGGGGGPGYPGHRRDLSHLHPAAHAAGAVGFNTVNGQNVPTDILEMCSGPRSCTGTAPRVSPWGPRPTSSCS